MRNDWKIMRLGDIASYINGFAFKPEDWSYKGLPIIRIQNLTENNGTFHYCQRKDIPSKYLVQKGDILISWSATLGVFEWILENALLNQHIFKVVFDKIEINKQYFKYAIHMSIDEMSRHTNGATMKHIRKGDFDNISIPVPSLSEQERIVSLLDTQFAKIDALKANAASQLQAAKDLFQSALKQLLTPKEGWEEKKLCELCSISGEYGLNEASTTYNGIRYLRITDITDNGDLNDDKVSAIHNSDRKQSKLIEGDILFARTGATVGKTLVYREDFGDCEFAGYLIRYRTNPNVILPRYLFYLTHSNNYYKWVAENQAAAAQPNISAQKYNNLIISFPSLPEQERIAARLDAISEKVKALQANYDQTITLCNDLKQSLLKSIFA